MQNDCPCLNLTSWGKLKQVSLINHLKWDWLQKTKLDTSSRTVCFSDSALSLSLCLREDRAQAVREARGNSGAKRVPEPRDASALTTRPWWGIRREEEWKKRPPGIRQSHPTKPCLPRTHIQPPLLPTSPFTKSPTLPKCQGRDLGDSANSALRLVGRGHKQRAERGVGRGGR